MPNRWIKEAYLAASRINAASPEARDLWIRLLVSADDHGLFHANPQLVASRCFPLGPDARKCARLLKELEDVRLIARYEADGRSYLRITQWYERPRSAPKYPLPPVGAGECGQMQASESNSKLTQAIARPHDMVHDHDHDHDHIHDHGPFGSSRVRATTPSPAPTRVLTEPAPEHVAFAAEHGLDVAAEFASYHDHFASIGKSHKDEGAGFRNWLRKAVKFQGERGRVNGSKRGQTLAERRVATMDAITGRAGNGTIDSTGRRIDPAPVPALPGDLRQPDGPDVGVH